MSNQDRSISERNGFELFFGVKTYDHYAETGSSIPPLIEKRTSSKRLNNTAIHFSKTSNPSTRNGAVDSQVVMPEGSLPQGIEGEEREIGKKKESGKMAFNERR
ncbi:hypothetical protein IEQ34_024484 [Dendrobium chrysotoxum]|uniref:Uncharacterized protein n=1 Tax=Dendrobium chrysotoxum TaxID=161865 RepID=A0AAV7FJD8_DENCH|nr:hypothetical protein IEQ34_024484 [Dendrobium chrysotoxum]